MSSQPEVPTTERAQVRLEWSDLDQVPVLAANQMLVQLDLSGDAPDQVILTLGHVTPPPVTGSPEQQMAALSAMDVLGIRTLSRVSVSLHRFEAFVDVMNQTKKRLDEVRASGGTSDDV